MGVQFFVLVVFLLIHAPHGSPSRLHPMRHARKLGQQPDETKELLSKYHSNAELEHHMGQIVNRCGGIARIIRWGKSGKGQDLVALELYGGKEEERYRPSFKYVGNVHGDEPSGRQLLLALADHVCRAYVSKQEAVTRLVGTVSLYIIPSMNPDGFDTKTRENSLRMDLNRNFPDPVVHKGHDLRLHVGKESPETSAMMNLTLSRRFVGSLGLHEGALVANYPMDGYADLNHNAADHSKVASEDDRTFMYLAKTYAALHTTMVSPSNREFPSGVTNGAQWYPVYGGMQDWNYLAAGCMEITLELNNDKWPTLPRLAEMWDENKEVFVQYPLIMVLGGLHGSVTTLAAGGKKDPLVAAVRVIGQGLNVTSSPTTGTFYRPLAPGKYSVLFEAPGFVAVTKEVELPEGGRGLVMEVELKSTNLPEEQKVEPKGEDKTTVSVQSEMLIVEGVSNSLSALQVMAYVLGVPLLGGTAFLLWRHSQDRSKKGGETGYVMASR